MSTQNQLLLLKSTGGFYLRKTSNTTDLAVASSYMAFCAQHKKNTFCITKLASCFWTWLFSLILQIRNNEEMNSGSFESCHLCFYMIPLKYFL